MVKRRIRPNPRYHRTAERHLVEVVYHEYFERSTFVLCTSCFKKRQKLLKKTYHHDTSIYKSRVYAMYYDYVGLIAPQRDLECFDCHWTTKGRVVNDQNLASFNSTKRYVRSGSR